EDVIRARYVSGVQTCALPIYEGVFYKQVKFWEMLGFNEKTRPPLKETPVISLLYFIQAEQLTSCPACRRPCRPCHPYQVRRQILLEFGLLLLQLLRTLRQRKLRFVVLNE